MSRTPTPGIDYTSRDYEGFRQSMIAELGICMPEYTDISSTDAGIVILENNAKCLDVISFYLDAVANETLLSTCKRRSNASKWCSILSYTPRLASPSKVMQVFVLTGVQPTKTIIPAGTLVKTQGSDTETEIVFETDEDLVIPPNCLGDEKDENGNYSYQVSATQGIPVEGELVGSSTGAPNQTFHLNYSPVIASSLQVIVNEGVGFEPWTRVDSFIDSGPDSHHFVLTITDNNESVIQFGDGVFGKIPTAFANGIFANYRVGGGTNGNVGANRITVMETNIAIVAKTFNPESVYERGQDRETVEEMKVNAPKSSELKWGALTLSDFSDVVLINFPDVVFAQSMRDTKDIDSIHIYILSKDGDGFSFNPCAPEYLMDVNNVEPFVKNTLPAGSSKFAGTDDFFELLGGVNLTCEGDNTSYPDGFHANQRLKTGGRHTTSNFHENSVRFTTVGALTFKVWWKPSGAGGRYVALWNEKGEEVARTEAVEDTVATISEMTVDRAGTYYIVTPVNGCAINKVDVTVGAYIPQNLLEQLNSFFDENEGGRKIVGTNEIFFEPAYFYPVYLKANLIVKDRYSRSKVTQEITELLKDYFAIGNYPFNEELSLSELAAYVMSADNAIQGIKSFVFTSPNTPVITPTYGQILTLGTLAINASGGEE